MTIVASIIHRSQHLKPTTEACTESVSKQAKIHRLTDQYGSEPSIFVGVATIHCPFPIECPKPHAWFSNLHVGVLVLAGIWIQWEGITIIYYPYPNDNPHLSETILKISKKAISQIRTPRTPRVTAPQQSLHSLQVAPPWWWLSHAWNETIIRMYTLW